MNKISTSCGLIQAEFADFKFKLFLTRCSVILTYDKRVVPPVKVITFRVIFDLI